ncbi:MAG: hypothetical protein QG608_1633, partial [Actinomycetota bacterium]|nr:hypothetical protein [Actinomycetota bacterium]
GAVVVVGGIGIVGGITSGRDHLVR